VDRTAGVDDLMLDVGQYAPPSLRFGNGLFVEDGAFMSAVRAFPEPLGGAPADIELVAEPQL
jgi:hypothetical protein